MAGEPERVLRECRVVDGTARIVLDDGEILELAAESLPPALPCPGEALPPPLLDALRAAAQRKAIARRVFRLLDRRLYGRTELERKLSADGFADDAIAAVLDRFAATGLIDDRRLAEAWCRDTLRDRPVGRRYLREKLRHKGLSAEVVAAVMDVVLPQEAEPAVARRALQRWRRHQRPQQAARLRQRAYRYLLGRGFGAAAAGAAVRDLEDEESDADPGDR